MGATRTIASKTRASGPISTRRLFFCTAPTMTSAALAGVVMKDFSNSLLATSAGLPVAVATLGSNLAERAMLVLMPPGWTHVALTHDRVSSRSWRSDSVKPRTAYLLAL